MLHGSLQQLSEIFKDVDLTGDSAPEFYIEFDAGFPDCRDPIKEPDSVRKRPELPGLDDDNWLTAKRFTMQSGGAPPHHSCTRVLQADPSLGAVAADTTARCWIQQTLHILAVCHFRFPALASSTCTSAYGKRILQHQTGESTYSHLSKLHGR
jgi:hypothetical protein